MTIASATSLRHLGALVCLYLIMTMNADAASEKMIFDFQATSNSTAWQVVNDYVLAASPPVSSNSSRTAAQYSAEWFR